MIGKLKEALSPYGEVSHQQNGQSFRVTVKPRAGRRADAGDAISKLFHVYGQDCTIDGNRDTIFVTWEERL